MYFVDKICRFICAIPPDFLLDGCAGRIARYRCGGRIRSFLLSISFHHGAPCSYIPWVMNNRPVVAVVQRRSLTHRHDLSVTKGLGSCPGRLFQAVPCVREVFSSCFGRSTGCHDSFRCFAHSVT
jgi:hypothetical protein